MLPNGGSHFVHITQSAAFHILEMWFLWHLKGFSIVFYRFLDGSKTMPILRNVLKSDTNKGDIMGHNEQWSFSMEFYSKSFRSLVHNF